MSAIGDHISNCDYTLEFVIKKLAAHRQIHSWFLALSSVIWLCRNDICYTILTTHAPLLGIQSITTLICIICTQKAPKQMARSESSHCTVGKIRATLCFIMTFATNVYPTDMWRGLRPHMKPTIIIILFFQYSCLKIDPSNHRYYIEYMHNKCLKKVNF